MSLVESVENIVVGALAQQDSFARWRSGHPGTPLEPDSRVVTRDIINKVADEVRAEAERRKTPGNFAGHFCTVSEWLALRSQAAEESET